MSNRLRLNGSRRSALASRPDAIRLTRIRKTPSGGHEEKEVIHDPWDGNNTRSVCVCVCFAVPTVFSTIGLFCFHQLTKRTDG